MSELTNRSFDDCGDGGDDDDCGDGGREEEHLLLSGWSALINRKHSDNAAILTVGKYDVDDDGDHAR